MLSKLKSLHKLMNDENSIKEVTDLFCKFNKEIALFDIEHSWSTGCEKEQTFFINCIADLSMQSVNILFENALQNIGSEEDFTLSCNYSTLHQFLVEFCTIMEMFCKTISSLSLSDHIFCKADDAVKLCGPSIVIIYYTFNNPNKKWSCKDDATTTAILLNSFLLMVKPNTLRECLNNRSNGFFQRTLKMLVPYLKRDVWKKHIAACYAYKELVENSESDSLVENLHMILPPILLFIDDYNASNVVIGLRLMSKVFGVVPSAELRMCGWAEVIYDALIKKLYARNPQIIDNCVPCLLLSIKTLERHPSKTDHCRMATKYDEAFQLIISNIHTTSDVLLIRGFWRHLGSFIEVLGITVARHLKDVVEIIQHHLEIADKKYILDILRTIETLVCVAWIRMEQHTPVILKHLLKLLLRISLEESKHDLKQYSEAIYRCISLLSSCNRNLVKDSLKEIMALSIWNKSDDHINFLNTLCGES